MMIQHPFLKTSHSIRIAGDSHFTGSVYAVPTHVSTRSLVVRTSASLFASIIVNNNQQYRNNISWNRWNVRLAIPGLIKIQTVALKNLPSFI